MNKQVLRILEIYIYIYAYIHTDLFRLDTYLRNKKHTLTCQGGTVITKLLTTSPVVSWRGWETTPPPPPRTTARLSFFAQPPLS